MVLRKLLALCLTVSLVGTGSPVFAAGKRKSTRSGRSAAMAARLQRMSRAFVASTDLRPMAEQLLENRTPEAYAGVQKFAEAHPEQDAGALAWLVIGYAHILDSQYPNAIAALKKAQPHAGELRDYVDYFLAMSQQLSGDSQGALATLHQFETNYPGSLFIRDAAVIEGNALTGTGQSKAAIDLLEAHRSPMRADLELALGRAQSNAGDYTQAAESLRLVYYQMPTAPEAGDAYLELQKLVPHRLPPASFADRKKRADLLTDNRRAAEAAGEYKDLIENAPAAEVYSLKVAMGGALWKAGRSGEARDLLQKLPETNDERNAQRLYYLVELSRSDIKHLGELITHLRETAPQSPWLQEALLATANQYLLQKDYATSARFFEELSSRFPNGKYASYANWKAAWMQLRQGDVASAKMAFERHIALYPASQEASAALYWRGRLAEDEKNLPLARAYYLKVSQRYCNAYYAELSRERLRNLGLSSDVADEPLLQKIPPAQLPGHFSLTAPADNLRVQKSMLLGNCGMVDFAIRELQAGIAPGDDYNWATAQMIKLYTEDGHYDRALQTLKRAVPGYFSFQLSDLPRPFWEGLFPRPYWDNLTQYSSQNQLDPYLVASLIRQESEFNPLAISRANAMGLMQILPSVGQQLAKSEKIKAFNSTMLLDPHTNIQLGTRYFKSLLNKYDGHVEYALAAYNAGSGRVDDWRKNNYRDIPEFVESIPITETREYVEAIVRNVAVYQRLYP